MQIVNSHLFADQAKLSVQLDPEGEEHTHKYVHNPKQ